MNGNTNTEDEYVQEIYSWLDNIPFSRPKRNVARDFSDGVLLAELLKRYYPKLVEIQNYISGNSIAKKLDNWNTLNRKVLPKLDIKLSKDTINQLAQSKSGEIEKLLMEIHSKIIKDCNQERKFLFEGCKEPDLEGSIKDATNPEEALNQTVPRRVFLKLKKELNDKTQAIHILIKKVEHLENMLRFKEQRIDDLTAQIQSSH